MIEQEEKFIKKLQKLQIRNIMLFISYPFILSYIITSNIYNDKVFLYFTICYIILHLTKFVLKRKRPFQNNSSIINLDLYKLESYSFPSAHAFTAWFIGYYYFKKFNFKNWFIIPILVGFSRIALGVHYPSDVTIGFIFAQICIDLNNYFNLVDV